MSDKDILPPPLIQTDQPATVKDMLATIEFLKKEASKMGFDSWTDAEEDIRDQIRTLQEELEQSFGISDNTGLSEKDKQPSQSDIPQL